MHKKVNPKFGLFRTVRCKQSRERKHLLHASVVSWEAPVASKRDDSYTHTPTLSRRRKKAECTAEKESERVLEEENASYVLCF